VNNPYFLAPVNTVQTATAYKAAIDESMAACGVDFVNLGMTLSAGTLTIGSNDSTGSALSSTNPAFVRLQDPDAPGRSKVISVEANQDFIDDAGASEIIGNLFGATTGVAWGNDCPFYLYAVSNDAMTSVAFMVCRMPHFTQSPAVGDIGAPDDPVANNQWSFFSLDSLDETLYDTNPCVCVGAFRMQMSASDDWTVQALSVDDGMGRFHEATRFSLPAGQMGAAAGTHILANAGTEPVWATQNYYYWLVKNEPIVRNEIYFENATAGVGAQSAEIVPVFIRTTAEGFINGLADFVDTSGGPAHRAMLPQWEPGTVTGFRLYDIEGTLRGAGNQVQNATWATNDDLHMRYEFAYRTV
jgi:hypothetical protein